MQHPSALGVLTIGASVKPLSILSKALNTSVRVELHGGVEFRGILDGYDPHLNLVLRNAEEIRDGKTVRTSELLVVRGDNVIYVSP